MSTKIIKVPEVVVYGGHSISQNGTVKLTVKAGYSELSNSIRAMQMLNNDVEIKAKLPEAKKAIRLGIFRIQNVIIDGDGESKIKFDGLNSFVEIDNLNELVSTDGALFKILMQAELDPEYDDEVNDEGEEED